MERLRAKDLERINAFLADLYELVDLAGFRQRLVSTLTRLVPADRVTLFESNARLNQVSGESLPGGVFDGELPSIYGRYFRESPLLRAYERGEGSAVMYSDFVSQRQLHRLGLYNEYLRKLDVEYRIAKGLPGRQGWVTSVLLDRTLTDFSDRDRLALNVLRPHLNQAYRNAAALTARHEQLTHFEHAVGALDQGLILLVAGGVVGWMSARARQWLAAYFPSARPPDGALPEPLASWLRRHAEPSGELLPPREPLVITRENTQLSVRLVSRQAQTLLVLDERYLAIPPEALRGLGLTRREAQVLAWVAEGKTSEEIATILGMKRRSVEKHLEHIYPKLGVETRTAAAARTHAFLAGLTVDRR